ncbi:saccharopine dehydrogenase family protein [Nocardiopsis valliformis]|uniref:saccharopine dehydrogenase family protein n=1 Tax=Nocardiopsis valliformis TaxID=239974 RepID=UPI000347D6BA|nr:saccharopine dehydrogenase NADP-binding domain-containing protein [Nocardiopsis valliformis]
MNLHHPTVAVFGAYGHTAVFVLAELRRRGLTPVLVGRDHERLRSLGEKHPDSPILVASVDEPASLERALAGTAAVVNCAGPFADTAPALLDAALRARIPYLDVGAEQAVALETFQHRQNQARDAGTAIIPSVAFYGGLGDLLATAAMGDWPEAEAIDIAFGLDSWQPTQGTRKTGRRNTGRHVVYSGGCFHRPSEQPATTDWDFPAPLGVQKVAEFSTADQVTVSRHLRVPDIRAHMNLAPLRDVHDPDTPVPRAVDNSGRSAQTFVVDVIVHRDGQQRRASASGRDIYAVTAPLVAEATMRILDGRARGAGGVYAVGELFDAEDFLRSLSPEHLSLDLLSRPVNAS